VPTLIADAAHRGNGVGGLSEGCASLLRQRSEVRILSGVQGSALSDQINTRHRCIDVRCSSETGLGPQCDGCRLWPKAEHQSLMRSPRPPEHTKVENLAVR